MIKPDFLLHFMQSSSACPAYMLQRKHLSAVDAALLELQRSATTAHTVLQAVVKLQLGSIMHYHIDTLRIVCTAVLGCGQLIANLLHHKVILGLSHQIAIDDPMTTQ